METKTPLVSVVIVNWNGLEDTKLCLSHTREQTYKNCELIIVDNGSDDDSLSFLRAQSDIVLVENPKNLGFTGGHIAGYEAAKGDYILLLNNDAVMQLDYIEKAVTYLQSNPAIGAVGGRAYLWDEANTLFDTTNDYYAYQNINVITAEGIFSRSDNAVPQEVNNVSGSCVLVPRSVIEKIGYLYDPFFAYYEESDFFARIKRAGYKVIYNPELAIWHGGGKTAQKKGSSFFYYMMMRNRFRFAVRNFDNWALKRFLKFYLTMGIISTIKAVLRGKTHEIEKAYAKAFFYNLFHIAVPFHERRQLLNKLGKDNEYTKQLIREQTGVSAIFTCHTKQEIEYAANFSQLLTPIDETIIVTDSRLEQQAKQFCDIDGLSLRLCIDRNFFSTHPENLGAVSAKNELLLITASNDFSASLLEQLPNIAYDIRRMGAGIVYRGSTAADSTQKLATMDCESTIVIRKSAFTQAGGLQANLKIHEATRALLVYGYISGQLLYSPGSIHAALPSLSDSSMLEEIVSNARSTYGQARIEGKKATKLGKWLDRHYHIQQVTNIPVWWLSPSVSFRLKLARSFNLTRFLVTLDRKAFALELKHIRNELLRERFMVTDLDSRNHLQKKRLDVLRNHPEQTTIFIICRDRFKTLRQLLDWLEAQGLTRIVLIDNDSALPPLVDFLKTTKYQVLEMHSNIGHTVAWSAGIIRVLLPDDFYLLTDPDVIPTQNSIDVVTHLYGLHAEHPDYLKVGLGLKIDDLPDHYDLKKEVISWESQFWKYQYSEGVYEAGVDTTFAVYKPYTYTYFIHPSLRTAEPFTARHLPWYCDSNQLTEEDVFYRLRADQNVNSWDKGKLPERYIAELAKQRH